MKHTEFYQQQYLIFKERLMRLEKIDEHSKRLKDQFGLVHKMFSILRIYIREHPFKNQQEEIDFFKHIKPRFYGTWLFTFEKHRLKVSLSKQTHGRRKSFLQQELDSIKRYFSQNQFYYHYYCSGATELDELCFLRNSGVTMITVPEISELEQEFSTACDLLFARFMAFEELKGYIFGLLNPPKKSSSRPVTRSRPTKLNLSVDQLGLLTRAADDARLVLGNSFSKICADLAPHLASREMEKVSPGSLRSNAYVGEERDKEETIRLLERMIKFIKGY